MQTEPTIHFNQRLDTEVQNLKTNECENGWEDQVEFQEIRSNDSKQFSVDYFSSFSYQQAQRSS